MRTLSRCLSRSISLSSSKTLSRSLFALVTLKRPDTLDSLVFCCCSSYRHPRIESPPDPRPSSSVTVPRRSLQRPSSELFVPPSPGDYKLEIAPELLLESCQAPSKSPSRAQRRSRYVCGLGGALLMSLISAAIMSPTNFTRWALVLKI